MERILEPRHGIFNMGCNQSNSKMQPIPSLDPCLQEALKDKYPRELELSSRASVGAMP
jgi:hypothetical protein